MDERKKKNLSLDPESLAYKYYAPGVGVVLEEEEERVELIEFTPA